MVTPYVMLYVVFMQKLQTVCW